jgi:hypothetical protein
MFLVVETCSWLELSASHKIGFAYGSQMFETFEDSVNSTASFRYVDEAGLLL